jgi:hypothetical protein
MVDDALASVLLQASSGAQLAVPPLQSPRLQAEHEGPPQGLHVMVEGPRGDARANVHVLVFAGDSQKYEGVTDATGGLTLPVPCHDPLQYFELAPTERDLARQGRAATKADQVPCIDGMRSLTMRLLPGGSLRILAVDSAERPVAGQVVVVESAIKGPDGQAYPAHFAATDPAGVAEVHNVPLGPCSLHGWAGRGFEEAPRQGAAVPRTGCSEVRLVFEVLPSDAYASMLFGELNGGDCDELFQLRDYRVEIKGWHALHPVSGDGLFCIEARDAFTLRVVCSSRGLSSQWLDMSRGEHLSTSALQWRPLDAEDE